MSGSHSDVLAPRLRLRPRRCVRGLAPSGGCGLLAGSGSGTGLNFCSCEALCSIGTRICGRVGPPHLWCIKASKHQRLECVLGAVRLFREGLFVWSFSFPLQAFVASRLSDPLCRCRLSGRYLARTSGSDFNERPCDQSLASFGQWSLRHSEPKGCGGQSFGS